MVLLGKVVPNGFVGVGAAEIPRATRIDILVGEPAFGLEEPAVAELRFVTENAGVAIDPVVVVRRGRDRDSQQLA